MRRLADGEWERGRLARILGRGEEFNHRWTQIATDEEGDFDFWIFDF